jgi:hypothetical protein
VLAGLAGDVWHDGLERLPDDELIGILRAGRRLTSWAAAMELAATADLMRRRFAEEEAGDAGVAEHATDEVAAALTLTGRAADRVVTLALDLARLPATAAALAAGEIDLARAWVIADETVSLSTQHRAAVEQEILGRAGGQTTTLLHRSVRRSVLRTDPAAVKNRKEAAKREARVERWDEPAGAAALAGRDLPAAEVLAADRNLTDVARQLKASGVSATMDQLRAAAYLALLSGQPIPAVLAALASRPPPRTARAETAGPPPAWVGTRPPPGCPGFPAGCPRFPPGWACLAPAWAGAVNLTMPLATWLGLSETPGEVAGYGPLDAGETRTLAAMLAAQDGTRWRLTLTDRKRPRRRPRLRPPPPAPAHPRRAQPRDQSGVDLRDHLPANRGLRAPTGVRRVRASAVAAASDRGPQRHLHLPRLQAPSRPLRPRSHPRLSPRRQDLRMQPRASKQAMTTHVLTSGQGNRRPLADRLLASLPSPSEGYSLQRYRYIKSVVNFSI